VFGLHTKDLKTFKNLLKTYNPGCSGKFGGTVSETQVPATGELAPRARRVAVLGVGAGGGRPLPLRGSGGVIPGNFLNRFLMPNPAFEGNLGQKIN